MKTVLITGAGGFVGGWMAEALHLSGRWKVRAGLRSWSGAARIARFPLDIVQCDLAQPESLDRVLADVDVVINCALVRGSAAAPTIQTLLQRAKAARVRKVVHLSSIAIYGDATGIVDEDTGPVGDLNAYARDKLAAETVCRAEAADVLPVSVLRPTLIYGPFSDTWTLPYVSRLASGKWRLLGEIAEGRANLVYVGDVIRFAVHLAEADVGPYAVFNANGPEIPTWNEYFSRFSEALGCGPLQQPARSAKLGLALRRPVRAAVDYLKTNYKDALLDIAARNSWLDRARQTMQSDLRFNPGPDELRLYGMDVEYSMAKARAAGFVPQTSLEAGLRYCAEWARDVGLVS